MTDFSWSLRITLYLFFIFFSFWPTYSTAEPLSNPKKINATKRDLSPPLSELVEHSTAPVSFIERSQILPVGKKGTLDVSRKLTTLKQPDRALQITPVQSGMPSPLLNFEGINNVFGVAPPDTCGDVGPDHYVQAVNLNFQVYDKSGNPLLADSTGNPPAINTIWSGFGGVCEGFNHGDPIVLYDQFADRWLISQFALGIPDNYHQCIAISKNGDPTDQWYRYHYFMSDTKMNDYPKFGVWPDGYYMSINQFVYDSGWSWAGQGAVVFDREAMLNGLSAPMIYFDMAANSELGAMLPSDADGLLPPPAGTPNYFIQFDDDIASSMPQDQLQVFEFHVDWDDPTNSTFTPASFSPLAVTPFNYLSENIPQPDTTRTVAALADRLMYRVQYRNFDSHASMVLNHSVDSGSGVAGIRWYELRDSGAGWGISQQSTYGGDGGPDGIDRWMGSIAMDGQGNMALGYSAAKADAVSFYPSIRYTGRLTSDAPGKMAQSEVELIAGSGSQTGSSRWGDYSMMSIDPVDDCTFWYTQEYYGATTPYDWQTRIGSFKFTTCTSEPGGELVGEITDSEDAPLADATVIADNLAGIRLTTTSLADGSYLFANLPTGDWNVNTEKWGYSPAPATVVSIIDDQITTQDFQLLGSPIYTLSGKITDLQTGWPLYAKIDYGWGFTWSNPTTGYYSVTLPQNSYNVIVTSHLDGYEEKTITLPLSTDTEQNFALQADSVSCNAPGYSVSEPLLLCEPPVDGGIVYGHVIDVNIDMPLNRALIDDQNGHTTYSVATPDNLAVADGLYFLYLPDSGTTSLTSSKTGGYGTTTTAVTVEPLSVQQLNFALPAGQIEATPDPISITMPADTSVDIELKISNSGAIVATIEVFEINAPVPSPVLGPFAPSGRHMSPKHLNDLDASSPRYEFITPNAPVIASAGEVIQTWDSGLPITTGLGFDKSSGKIWVGDFFGGNTTDHAFTANGDPTGEQIIYSGPDPQVMFDFGYDWINSTLWQIGLRNGDCIYEIDPGAQAFSGNTICLGFSVSQRGLAYNPKTDTFYSGSWNDSIVYEFDRSGTILRSVDTGLAIAGLAFASTIVEDLLYVVINGTGVNEIVVLDVNDSFTPLGQFDIPGFGDYGGSGLAMDCNGHLWALDSSTEEVFEVDSGEIPDCSFDIDWLNVSPTSATLAGNSQTTLTVSIDSTGYSVDTISEAHLRVKTDTPYGYFTIPVTMTVSDTPTNTLLITKESTGSGSVTSSPGSIGCGPTCSEASDSFDWNESVTLTATPEKHSSFTEWSGDGCMGADFTCTVLMNHNRDLNVMFTLDTYPLTVNKSGNGSGSVSSEPAGITCEGGCMNATHAFDWNSEVSLTATPYADSTFIGWSGGKCDGSTNPVCLVTVTEEQTETAMFTIGTIQLTVTKSGNGDGLITSNPGNISCDNSCSSANDIFVMDTTVTLNATEATGSFFSGWSGDGCIGTGTECTVQMDQARTITTEFTLDTHTLNITKEGSGGGTILSNPVGINCGPECNGQTTFFDWGTGVVLDATPAKGSRFKGWSGDCIGKQQKCFFTVDQEINISARFEPVFPYYLFVPGLTGGKPVLQ